MLAKNLEHMTLNEFNSLDQDDNFTHELLDGVFLMSPRPNFLHQRVQSNLVGNLFTYLKGKPCNVITEMEVSFKESVVVPDLFVYCDDVKEPIQRYSGVPKLVIEILSPSTAFYDTTRKMRIYEQMGVIEYWIVSPTAKSVTIHDFEHEKTLVFGLEDVISSEVLKDFSLPVNDLF